jgi:hypothetical protein
MSEENFDNITMIVLDKLANHSDCVHQAMLKGIDIGRMMDLVERFECTGKKNSLNGDKRKVLQSKNSGTKSKDSSAREAVRGTSL